MSKDECEGLPITDEFKAEFKDFLRETMQGSNTGDNVVANALFKEVADELGITVVELKVEYLARTLQRLMF